MIIKVRWSMLGLAGKTVDLKRDCRLQNDNVDLTRTP